MTIMCIGQSTYDITVQLEAKVEENKKYRIYDDFRCIGGPAFNASYLLGKWGQEVYLVSAVGKDDYGRIISEKAKEENVHLDYLTVDDSWATPYSNIYVHDGNRTIFNHLKPFKHYDLDFKLPKVDVVLTDGHMPEVTLDIFDKYPQAVKVMDLGSYRCERMPIAQRVDYLIVSEQFAKDILHKEITEDCYSEAIEAVEKVNLKTAVITLGDRGLLYRDNGEVRHMDAYLTDTVDSTGAGDIFHAAFVYGLATGLDFEDNLRFSSMTASLSTEKLGSSTSIPELQKVIERLKK